MSDQLPLSPIPSTDKWCEACERETYHSSYLTALNSNPLAKYYELACEPCMEQAHWDYQESRVF
jgi:hypothetical protein